MQVVIKIDGDKEVADKVRRLGESLLQLEGAMGEIGRQTIGYYSGQGWASRGGVFQSIWPNLADSTMRARTRGVQRGRLPILARTNLPLEVSGDMRKGFQATVTNSSVKITNVAPYFIYHQSSAPRHRLPRRQMMGVNDPVKRIIKEAITAAIKDKIRTT